MWEDQNEMKKNIILIPFPNHEMSKSSKTKF